LKEIRAEIVALTAEMRLRVRFVTPEENDVVPVSLVTIETTLESVNSFSVEKYSHH
jgi:hypothetical protein